ncbi:protein kinase [Streptomyces sp. NPDC017943]|uniref:serine/threonine-protein kinase n=1 Tax=Streptomyces sp. NPDC017943 TaxID=3365019 RepID=UPI0037B941DA
MHPQQGASSGAKTDRLVAGRYRLLSVLGNGGMGTVWRARDETLHRDVAVKEVLVPMGLSEDRLAKMYSRLEREAWAAARVNARGVVTVHDVVTYEGRPCIVMELVQGRSLDDFISEHGPVAPREAARIGTEILAALRAAHAAGVLHRDVKPANVLLGDDDRVVLTDFGIAFVEGDSALTMTGEVVGSPEYLAPERALGRTPGPESDLYSLGVLLYAAVQGRSPFRRTTPLSTLRAVVDEELPPPHRAGPLAPLIEGLMRKDPSERMSAEQAARELRLAASDVTGPSVVLEPSTTDEQATIQAQPVSAIDEAVTTDGIALNADAPPTDARREADTTTAARSLTTPAHGAESSAEPVTQDPAEAAVTVDTPVPPTTRAASQEADETLDTERPEFPEVPKARSVTPHADAAASNADAPTVDGPASTSPAPVPVPVPVPADAPGRLHASGSHRPGRNRRGVYTWAAGALFLALVAGGISYATIGGDDEEPASAAAPAGQTDGAGSGTERGAANSGGQSVSVAVQGRSTTYSGACPPGEAAPWFTATFTVSATPVQFSYRWVSSEGTAVDSQWQTLAFRQGDPRTQQETVRLSAYTEAGAHNGAMAVEIRSPFNAVSNSVPFSLTCVSASG